MSLNSIREQPKIDCISEDYTNLSSRKIMLPISNIAILIHFLLLRTEVAMLPFTVVRMSRN